MKKGESLREKISLGFLPEFEGTECLQFFGRQAPEIFETVCFWCDFPFSISIQTRAAKLVPICCPRCKAMFWF